MPAVVDCVPKKPLWTCTAFAALLAILTPLCLASPHLGAAAGLPELGVSGKFITTPDGKPFVIKGVALDARLVADGAYGRTGTELARYYHGLGLNAFRLTFNCTREAVGDFAAYLDRAIDPFVRACAAEGMFVVLDMHEYRWPAPDKETPGFREQWLAAWQTVARRYLGEPTIAAYELWNEPDLVYGCKQGPTDHREWLTECIRAVREIDKRHVLIVNGVQGGFGPQTPITWGAEPRYDPSKPEITFGDVRRWRNPDPEKRLAFAFHCGFFDTNRALGPNILPYHMANHRVIVDAFADAHNVPVIMTEWEDEPPDTATREFMVLTAAWLRADSRKIGWLLWRLHSTDDLAWWQKRFAQERPAERWHLGELDPPYADIWVKAARE